jgi:hypothetical protein
MTVTIPSSSSVGVFCGGGGWWEWIPVEQNITYGVRWRSVGTIKSNCTLHGILLSSPYPCGCAIPWQSVLKQLSCSDVRTTRLLSWLYWECRITALNLARISIFNKLFEEFDINIKKRVNWSPIVTPIEVFSSARTTAYCPARGSRKALDLQSVINQMRIVWRLTALSTLASSMIPLQLWTPGQRLDVLKSFWHAQ